MNTDIHDITVERPPFPKMLARGFVRRCPYCGGRGAFFRTWFRMNESCNSCGLRWRRGDVGFELGAAAISAIMTLGTIVIGVLIGVIATWPDIAVGPLTVTLIVVAVVVPIVTFPLTYTIWQAIDLLMRPPQAEDFDVS